MVSVCACVDTSVLFPCVAIRAQLNMLVVVSLCLLFLCYAEAIILVNPGKKEIIDWALASGLELGNMGSGVREN